MTEITIPNCPRCGSQMIKVKDKDYYGCPNWLPSGQNGCEGDIWFQPGTRQSNYPNVAFSFKVESKSNPGHWHQVKFYESGDSYCGCVAHQMGKFCSHQIKATESIEKIIEKIKKDNFSKKSE